MPASWENPFPEFDALILETIAREGDEATLARLLAKLDELELSVRREQLFMLAIVPLPAALEWLEARIESPVVERWGITAALLGIRWNRIAAWLKRGRPHSLAALDTLVAYAHPHPGCSQVHREAKPLLVDPPSLDELRGALEALAAVDDAPRVVKTIELISRHADEILRGGSHCGTSVKAIYERSVEESAARRRLWSESRTSLPDPHQPLVADAALRSIWERRWQAAVRACKRRGGSGHVTMRSALTANELVAIELELGFALPTSLAALFTGVAAKADATWRLPESSAMPTAYKELLWGACTWDARRLPELERTRRDWVEHAFRDPNDHYDRVWRNKLAIVDVPNGDMIAVDLERADVAPVVYLSHEDGPGHGRVLGYSVLDFIDRWTLLGCVGPEDWLMTPFLRADQPYLDPVGGRAQEWRAWLGISVLAVM